MGARGLPRGRQDGLRVTTRGVQLVAEAGDRDGAGHPVDARAQRRPDVCGVVDPRGDLSQLAGGAQLVDDRGGIPSRPAMPSTRGGAAPAERSPPSSAATRSAISGSMPVLASARRIRRPVRTSLPAVTRSSITRRSSASARSSLAPPRCRLGGRRSASSETRVTSASMRRSTESGWARWNRRSASSTRRSATCRWSGSIAPIVTPAVSPRWRSGWPATPRRTGCAASPPTRPAWRRPWCWRDRGGC